MAGNFWRSSHYLEWLLDHQDVIKYRLSDIKQLEGEENYQKIMVFFAGVIQVFGEKLVRQQVIATATVYFKRYYSRYSLKTIDPWLMAPTCIFLASKVEECGVLSHKSLMQACINIVKSRYQAYLREYVYRIHDIYECEFILLEVMDCCLVVYHPYRSLTQFCADLGPTVQEVIQPIAWRIVNDSLRTDVCLYNPPYIIALACLHMACVIANKKDTLAWFAELSVDMTKIMDVNKQLLGLYEMWKNFNEEAEMPSILDKMPKAQPQPNKLNYNSLNSNVNSHYKMI